MPSASVNGQRRNHIAPYLPWADGSGYARHGWTRLRFPFVLIYIVASWVLFVPAAEPRDGLYWIDDDAIAHLLYQIPDLTRDLPAALFSLVTAPWLNHDSLQLVYVTILLLLFGIIFELREGTLRIIALFFGTTVAAAILAGALLHLIYPDLSDDDLFRTAWGRNWSGGSAGCFGLMGAIAARARKPWALIALFLTWEAFIWTVNLRNYTSVFHLFALTTGFTVTRYLIPPIHRPAAPKVARNI